MEKGWKHITKYLLGKQANYKPWKSTWASKLSLCFSSHGHLIYLQYSLLDNHVRKKFSEYALNVASLKSLLKKFSGIKFWLRKKEHKRVLTSPDEDYDLDSSVFAHLVYHLLKKLKLVMI